MGAHNIKGGKEAIIDAGKSQGESGKVLLGIAGIAALAIAEVVKPFPVSIGKIEFYSTDSSIGVLHFAVGVNVKPPIVVIQPGISITSDDGSLKFRIGPEFGTDAHGKPSGGIGFGFEIGR